MRFTIVEMLLVRVAEFGKVRVPIPLINLPPGAESYLFNIQEVAYLLYGSKRVPAAGIHYLTYNSDRRVVYARIPFSKVELGHRSCNPPPHLEATVHSIDVLLGKTLILAASCIRRVLPYSPFTINRLSTSCPLRRDTAKARKCIEFVLSHFDSIPKESLKV